MTLIFSDMRVTLWPLTLLLDLICSVVTSVSVQEWAKLRILVVVYPLHILKAEIWLLLSGLIDIYHISQSSFGLKLLNNQLKIYSKCMYLWRYTAYWWHLVKWQKPFNYPKNQDNDDVSVKFEKKLTTYLWNLKKIWQRICEIWKKKKKFFKTTGICEIWKNIFSL